MEGAIDILPFAAGKWEVIFTAPPARGLGLRR